MKKIGFECEYFVVKDNKPVDVRKEGIACDECGYLAEARGEPSSDPIKAVYNLLAEEKSLREIISKRGYKMIKTPFMKLNTKDFLRKYGKNPIDAKNFYGKNVDSNSLPKAGLHVHFSEGVKSSISDTEGRTKEIEIFSQLDMPTIIRNLDKKYSKEIKNSKRVTGNYELKNHGFEYRSLPNNLSEEQLFELAKVCFTLF